MTKSEFIRQLAQRARFTRKEAQQALDTTLELIVGAVARGEKVTFAGFGTFEPFRRKAARRFNPQTRRPIQVPAKTVPKFRAGKRFKEAVARRRR